MLKIKNILANGPNNLLNNIKSFELANVRAKETYDQIRQMRKSHLDKYYLTLLQLLNIVKNMMWQLN
ncbi:hypothetical protein MFE_00340 [Mycoplasmopsis fermentans JER]|nr:hypothetical protein MFE_00340 [Mycoplasmopsis fermentans JER]